jgi:hypothetical protein
MELSATLGAAEHQTLVVYTSLRKASLGYANRAQDVSRQPAQPEIKPTIPTTPAGNGYPTPSSTSNSIKDYAKQEPQAPAIPLANGLPAMYNAAPLKQTQLPFQPVPQYAMKPSAPVPQPQHHPLPQHHPYQQPNPQQSAQQPPP